MKYTTTKDYEIIYRILVPMGCTIILDTRYNFPLVPFGSELVVHEIKHTHKTSSYFGQKQIQENDIRKVVDMILLPRRKT